MKLKELLKVLGGESSISIFCVRGVLGDTETYHVYTGPKEKFIEEYKRYLDFDITYVFLTKNNVLAITLIDCQGKEGK